MLRSKIVEEGKIVAHIHSEGDRSVGLNGYSLKVTIEGLDLKKDIESCFSPENEGRKNFRESLEELFSEWLDGKVGVVFDDECIDCGTVFEKKKRGSGYKKHKCPMSNY